MMYLNYLAILILVLTVHSFPNKHRLKNIPYKSVKLPTNVIPSNYNLQLTLTKDGLEKDNKFSGIVKITINGKEDNLKSISLHSKYLDIELTNVIIANKDGSANIAGTTTLDGDNELLIIALEEPLPKDVDFVITIPYSGSLSTTSMNGFYKSTYLKDGSKTMYIATTQFESTYARQAFPCFDEPSLKATFDITINHPIEYKALANTIKLTDASSPGITIFQTTPEMSTYLVAFIVSQFECDGNINTNYYCGPTSSNLEFIKDVVPKSLAAMENFTNKPYKSLGQEHLTQVAIPDFEEGAMENWGLITYREALVYVDENRSTLSDKQKVLTTVTHELSHLWFGDYMTLDWWNDIFLNEGFATYFQYYAADINNEKMELPKQFVIDQLQTALLSDSTMDSHPLSTETIPQDISSNFDTIAYNKGGSLLRMIQHIMGGPENFKLAMIEYIGLRDTTPERLATIDKLYKGLQEIVITQNITLPTENIKDILDAWIKKPGYPVLNVKLTGTENKVSVTQERFILSGEPDKDSLWYIPITYSQTKQDFQNTMATHWLTPDLTMSFELDIEKNKWIVFNNQQTGFYRVKYEKKLLDRISTTLSSVDSINDIDEISRSQLIDDQFNFASQSGIYNDLLTFVNFLKAEVSYYTWSSAFRGYNSLLQRLNNPKLKETVMSSINKQMSLVLQKYPIDAAKPTEHMDVLAHVLINTWACKFNEEKCQTYVSENFDKMLADVTKVPVDLRSIVYCNGLRTKGEDAFSKVFQQYTTSTLATEKLMLLKALGCTNTDKSLSTYLEDSLTDAIRIQDVSYVYDAVLSNHDNGVTLVLNFLLSSSAKFKDRFGSYDQLSELILKVSNLITNDEQLKQLQKITNDDIKDVLEMANSIAAASIKQTKIAEQALISFFDGGDTSGAYSNQFSLALILLFVFYLIFN